MVRFVYPVAVDPLPSLLLWFACLFVCLWEAGCPVCLILDLFVLSLFLTVVLSVPMVFVIVFFAMGKGSPANADACVCVQEVEMSSLPPRPAGLL